MEIGIDNRSGEELPLEEYDGLARFILASEGVGENVELALSFVDEAEMRELNRVWRGIDAPTDVLSFGCDDQADQAGGELFLLGDCVVAPAVAREHARDFDSTFDDEMRLMITHGVLHLLGMDHEQDDEAQRMQAREEQLLGQWAALREGGGQRPEARPATATSCEGA
jgi:probable rRNA maturation factor